MSLSATKPIRVLVVDDSAITRKILSDALSADPELQVVGAAPDAIVAANMIRSLKPDVLTLDLEMPRMDGLTFLRKLMSTTPMPVIVVSSMARSGGRAAMEAFEAGAVDVVAKPAASYAIGELKQTLARKVRAAVTAGRRLKAHTSASPAERTRHLANFDGGDGAVIAIGASTGGTEAIRQVLEVLPPDSPPIVIVQHMPPVFSRSFAERLDQLCRIRVREAVNGDRLERGLALVAPGDYHVVLHAGVPLHLETRQGPRVCYQRPAVDVLFQSAARVCGKHTVGVILTGMGNDGAAGLLALRQSGAHTIAQDETTSVVYGMPAEAVRMGAAKQVLPLQRIAEAIIAAARAMPGRSSPAKQSDLTPGHTTQRAS